MGKNKIIITLILSFIFIKPIFAADEECNSSQNSCKIKDSTAQVLQDYIKDVRKVTQNVTKSINDGVKQEATSTDSKLKKDTTRIKDEFIKSMNSITNWDTFFPSFKFVELQITSEVPYEVVRDRNLLKNEAKNLQSLMESITRKGYSEKVITSVCSGIENCDLDGKTAGFIMTELIKNTNKIMVLFDTSITGGEIKNINIDFILVNNSSFKNQLVSIYNQNTLTECSMCKGFWSRAKKTIDKISLDMFSSKDAIKKWKQAWAKLQGAIAGTTSREEERAILNKELARQGLNTSQAAIILKNLDKFNNGAGISMDNNPIINTLNSIKQVGEKIANATKDALDPFYKAISNKKDSNGNTKPTDLEKESARLKEANEILKKIAEEHSKVMILAGNETKGTEEIISEIIQLHMNLSQIAKILNDTIENAEKACFGQGRGMGNCSAK